MKDDVKEFFGAILTRNQTGFQASRVSDDPGNFRVPIGGCNVLAELPGG